MVGSRQPKSEVGKAKNMEMPRRVRTDLTPWPLLCFGALIDGV